MNATLIGGHSIEGPRTTIGFTMLGRQRSEPATKDRLGVGHRLLLTKPLGTGILLAALMQGRLPAAAYQPLIESMTLSNAVALDLIREFRVTALTDVTGFGLAGHLAEMLRASGCSAELERSRIASLPSTQELVDQGIESTLAPENRVLPEGVTLSTAQLTSAQTAVLFDPQTSGGLLIGVAAGQVESVLERLRSAGHREAAEIGVVREAPRGSEIRVR